jgi:predicted HAD superfamily Cof-like phosphohydrolase
MGQQVEEPEVDNSSAEPDEQKIHWTKRRPPMGHYNDVRDFHYKFGLITNHFPGLLTKRKLQERVECMMEELGEFKAACDQDDLEGQADALVDLVYFALGTAVMMGIPWDPLWNDVHRANMEKVRGVSHRGHKVDCVKPKNWLAPQTKQILKDYSDPRVPFQADDEVHNGNK